MESDQGLPYLHETDSSLTLLAPVTKTAKVTNSAEPDEAAHYEPSHQGPRL